MTPWGEPDIQATLDMMQASRVPLERCADSYLGRRLPTFLFGDAAGAGGGARARPCDMEKAWLTQAEYDAAHGGSGATRATSAAQALAEGDLGRSLRTGTHRPQHSAAADQSDRRSAERAAARADPGRQAPSARDAQRLDVAGRESHLRRRRRTSTAGTAASRAACPRR